jgi:hypothetical protein
MFFLVTGLPGSGKTLWTINHLKNGVLNPENGEKRPIFYYGIPHLNPILGWIPLQNPKNWHEEVPDTAIVVIDEVQEHFPVRSPSSAVPPALAALERHRHRGLDLYFLTQDARLLDHHARRLAGQHILLKRNFGAPFAVVFKNNGAVDDPNDYKLLRKAEKSTFKYPKDTFNLYKSSELHTHKFEMPKMVWVLVALVIIVAGSATFFYRRILNKSAETIAATTGVIQTESGQVSSAKLDQNAAITLESLKPIITNVPASAPAYQEGWKPVSVPIVSSCIANDTNCRCYTCQATPVAVSPEFCRNAVINGLPFDHTLPDNRMASSGENHRATR